MFRDLKVFCFGNANNADRPSPRPGWQASSGSEAVNNRWQRTEGSGNSFERQQQRQQQRQQCAACAAAFLVESASFIKFETAQRGAVVRSIMIYATLKSNWISDTNCCHNPRDMARGSSVAITRSVARAAAVALIDGCELRQHLRLNDADRGGKAARHNNVMYVQLSIYGCTYVRMYRVLDDLAGSGPAWAGYLDCRGCQLFV